MTEANGRADNTDIENARIHARENDSQFDEITPLRHSHLFWPVSGLASDSG